jgi:RNA polymerase sigma-70 factor (ECF subfamily)
MTCRPLLGDLPIGSDASDANVFAAAPALAAQIPTERSASVPVDFDATYDAYFDFVWRSVRQLGVHEASVDDAVQDVFMVVYRRRAEFEARSSMRTWLFGIAIRVVHDYRRRFRRKGGQEPLSVDLRDAAPGPFERLEASEAIRAFERLLEGLDETKRNVFILSEVEQLSGPEVAELLRIPLNTVYSRLRAARQAFELAVRDHAEKGETHAGLD